MSVYVLSGGVDATLRSLRRVPPYRVVTGVSGTDGIGLPAGGTTGQRPEKASNTDYDIIWTDDTSGGSDVDLSGLVSWVNGAITLNDDTGIPQTITINLAGWIFPGNITAQQFVGDGSQLTNVNPNSVTFVASTNVTPSTLVESADVTITGVSNGLWPIDVTGGNSSQLRINSGSWVTAGLVQPNDVVRMRTTSPAALGNTEVTLRMPRRRATWSVTSGSGGGGGGGPSLDFSNSTNSMYIGAIL